MKKLDYWMLGRVSIPKDKRDELNRYVLKVLDKGGIRLTEEIEIAGEPVTVVNKPIPDEEGIINFNYSVFEEIERKTCTYNTKTCQLKLKDPGGNEFGLIMNLIMVLQEAYSSSQCFMMYKNNISDVYGYLCILYGLLDKRIIMHNRSNTWDMVLFLRKNKIEIGDKIFTSTPFGYRHFIEAQFRAGMCKVFDIISVPETNEIIQKKSEIASSHFKSIEYFAYEAMTKLYKQGKETTDCFIYQIVSSGIRERKRIAKREDLFGDIAEVSLYVLPATIIRIYSNVSDIDFWELWDRIENKPYKSILGSGLEKKADPFLKDAKKLDLFISIKRENEDEFFESWEEDDLILSDRVKACMERWKHQIAKEEDIHIDNVAEYLRDTINELYDAIECRYVDRDFVELLLKNKTNPNYIKALAVIRNSIYPDLDLFPELTKSQAKEWVINKWRDSYDKTIVMALHSLIINETKRKKILGF